MLFRSLPFAESCHGENLPVKHFRESVRIADRRSTLWQIDAMIFCRYWNVEISLLI
ncbi:hypothetical protein BCAR13_270010 [Paraburkholderia caribensis]|nr:hypothetical protein BCAR13_270010 [Paraburkholderia caribensis]